MNKGILSIIALSSVLLLLVIIAAVSYISISNQEIRLRNQADAVQIDNTNEFDNMWKKITQITQVTKAERESVERIIVGYADARTGDGGRGSFINAVREALPTIDNSTFINLQNIIVSSRDRFMQRQKQLIDIKREHDNLIMTFPGSLIVGSRPKLNITIVTSTRTEEVFETGKDNNVDLGL